MLSQEELKEIAKASQTLLNAAKSLRAGGKMPLEMYADIVEMNLRSMIALMAGDIPLALTLNSVVTDLCHVAISDYAVKELQ